MNPSAMERGQPAGSFEVAAAWSTIAAGVLQLGGGPVEPLVATSSPAHGLIIGLNSLNHLLLLVGMVGLARSGALNGDLPARGGTVLSVIGFAVLALAEPTTLASEDLANILFGIGSLGVAVGLILAGIATLTWMRD